MRITVVGGSGLIGKKLVAILKDAGHKVVGASRSSGVDVLTGAGVADALAGADALVDVTNPPSSEPGDPMKFFVASSTNLVDGARLAGVPHYVALSIVGVDRLPASPYFLAKVAQERIITESGIPHSIVRATQFDEFIPVIIESMTVGNEIRVPDALIQPIAAADVAAAVAYAAAGQPINGIVNVSGPVKVSFEQLARSLLARRGDTTTTVVVDPRSGYFGTPLEPNSLVTPDR